MMERNSNATIERKHHSPHVRTVKVSQSISIKVSHDSASTCAPVKISREALGLQRGGHEHNAEVWARGEQLAEEEEEQVRLRVALVHL